jgi:transposase
MEKISRIGIDLAKSVFQLHGVDAAERVVLRRRCRRSEVLKLMARLAPCRVGLEACATAHWWARQLQAMGHAVVLLAPAAVKRYADRGKSDAIDAAAICEAMSRPTVRSVPVKSVEQQAMLSLHRVREGLVRERTASVNRLRALLAEFGLIAGTGRGGLAALVARATDSAAALPEDLQLGIELLLARIADADARLKQIERQLLERARLCPQAQLLQTIPGIGPITATALAASLGDIGRFRSARHLAAWLGLTPRQHSTGGKIRLGRISKMGDSYLRRLLVLGATARLVRVHQDRSATGAWIRALLERKSARLVTIAIANKTARIAWAVLRTGQPFRHAPAA